MTAPRYSVERGHAQSARRRCDRRWRNDLRTHVRQADTFEQCAERVDARSESSSDGAARDASAIQYGHESPTTIAWDDAAEARMKKMPASGRGMVVRPV